MDSNWIGILSAFLAVIAATSASCPGGWTEFSSSGRCFKLYHEKKNFNDSRDACVEYGAVLASIPNTEVHDYLVGLMPNTMDDAWMGLYRLSHDQTLPLSERKRGWLWMDGSYYGWDRWYSGEPTGDSDCARLSRRDGWKDIKCKTTYPYFCQKDQGSTTSTPATTTTAATTTTKPVTTTTTTTSTTTTTIATTTPQPTTSTTTTTTTSPAPVTTTTTTTQQTPSLTTAPTSAPTPAPSPTTAQPSSSSPAPTTTQGSTTLETTSLASNISELREEEIAEAWKVHNTYKSVLIAIFCLVGIVCLVIAAELFIIYRRKHKQQKKKKPEWTARLAHPLYDDEVAF